MNIEKARESLKAFQFKYSKSLDELRILGYRVFCSGREKHLVLAQEKLTAICRELKREILRRQAEIRKAQQDEQEALLKAFARDPFDDMLDDD